MPRVLTRLVDNVAGRFGYRRVFPFLSDAIEPDFVEIYRQCRPNTMTSVERMYALYQAVRYVLQADIKGDIVECGVWRGGSSMLAALTLLRAGETTRNIHLYDTFSGMSEPTDQDFKVRGGSEARKFWKRTEQNGSSEWCYAPLEEVQKNMRSTGYPEERMCFIKGKVEETIPVHLPGPVSLLRLDTDWYESTFHELVHLYPLLTRNGILLLDDYGCWAGARLATDTYLSEKAIPMLLSRIDDTGRLGVKAHD